MFEDEKLKETEINELYHDQKSAYRFVPDIICIICISGIALSTIVATLLIDSSIIFESPFGAAGVVFKEPAGGWVVSLGAIQIPVYVIAFGLIGGYLRYLFGLRFIFESEAGSSGGRDIDALWADVDITDKLLGLKHYLRSLAIVLLAPFVAMLWFLFFGAIVFGATLPFLLTAAISLLAGLLSENFLRYTRAFIRGFIRGFKEERDKERAKKA